jgi:ornithine cyclodeaminase/alanine dehydrogenase-like protein (mu-crystallin family)
MLFLSRTDVERLLDPLALIDALAAAMVDLSAGRAHLPARIAALVPPHQGLLAAMPAYVPSIGALVTKLVSVFPHNRDRPSHQAVVACFDPATGEPTAIMDGASITAFRTAAGSALATRLLARPDATTLAVLGTGVQAREHALAVARVRALSRVVVCGRDGARTTAFAGSIARSLPCEVGTADDYQTALAGADIVCATTHAAEPVVRRAWLRAGTHVNSVGYNTNGREVDAETVAAATVVVESRAAALAPPPAGSPDLLWAVRDGAVGPAFSPAEIGEVIDRRRPGRTGRDEITLYKSVGIGVQDAAAAMLVLEAASKTGLGQHVAL